MIKRQKKIIARPQKKGLGQLPIVAKPKGVEGNKFW